MSQIPSKSTVETRSEGAKEAVEKHDSTKLDASIKAINEAFNDTYQKNYDSYARNEMAALTRKLESANILPRVEIGNSERSGGFKVVGTTGDKHGLVVVGDRDGDGAHEIYVLGADGKLRLGHKERGKDGKEYVAADDRAAVFERGADGKLRFSGMEGPSGRITVRRPNERPEQVKSISVFDASGKPTHTFVKMPDGHWKMRDSEGKISDVTLYDTKFEQTGILTWQTADGKIGRVDVGAQVPEKPQPAGTAPKPPVQESPRPAPTAAPSHPLMAPPGSTVVDRTGHTMQV